MTRGMARPRSIEAEAPPIVNSNILGEREWRRILPVGEERSGMKRIARSRRRVRPQAANAAYVWDFSESSWAKPDTAAYGTVPEGMAAGQARLRLLHQWTLRRIGGCLRPVGDGVGCHKGNRVETLSTPSCHSANAWTAAVAVFDRQSRYSRSRSPCGRSSARCLRPPATGVEGAAVAGPVSRNSAVD